MSVLLCVLAIILLAPAPAHAGSYVGPYYSGGQHWMGTEGFVLDTATNTPIWNPGGSYEEGGPNVDASLTAVFNWVPATGMTAETDPPPLNVIIMQSAACGWAGAGTETSSDGLGDPQVVYLTEQWGPYLSMPGRHPARTTRS